MADWFASSYSGNGTNCVEVADLGDWFKSSYSGNGQDCVEVADLTHTPHRRIAIRDSKNPTGPALLLTPAHFAAFIAGVRAEDRAA
ncbi:DUF397 domain-containing protein [Streptomyces sp. DSM 44917]|uniref:DUF397 domain-containing protein n=1 Tax=Streptomyces boetiae TaxID=3075541 RepID=A0ABU2L3B0_9ACTN|nr:DUF397 domain-containing protein [Streptomyces sp. DSM 44917]MDT0305803.1 DUF397 domain-containing protein [Streptomyces sp. DSM 44917]